MKKQSFLASLAQQCQQEYGHEADRLTVVFPNRRAGLFFSKHLGQLTDKPMWSPQVVSLEDFILSRSTLAVADPLQLICMLYAVYKRVMKNAEGFDRFYYWGEMILKDFGEIDSYLVNPEQIFTVVKSQKELDESFYFLSEEDQKVIKSFWSGFLPKATKTQSDFLNTWKILYALYGQFRAELQEQGLAYKGMIYREVAERIADMQEEYPVSDVWFAGFNAFTSSEEKIIKYFVQEKSARMFWDVDAYYLKDEFQESGFFFRQYRNDPVFGKTFPKELPEAISRIDKKVTVHAVSLIEGQVKAVGEQLEGLAATVDFEEEKTVVVLPDENLLLPLMNAIPETIKKVNITMGYPLKNSRYYSFFDSLLNLHAHVREGKEGKSFFYYKQVQAMLGHEVCRYHFAADVEMLNDYIRKHNSVHLSPEELDDYSALFRQLFVVRTNVEQIVHFFQELMDAFAEKAQSALDKAVLGHLQVALKNILHTSLSYDIALEKDVFVRLYRQLGASVKVPFAGEPLQGIQVMGVLETRNLDFDHVFVISMNEGVFPSDASNSSFIPYNIRRAFDLPVMEHHDALQSYLFYRLFQCATSVDMYYNNISEFNHSGEVSRLVRQLELESDMAIAHQSLVNPVKAAPVRPVVVHKEGWVLESLDQYLVSTDRHYTRLSPSALNTYLDCRLRFFYRYVEKIYEPEEVTDDLDPALFGNLLHTTMEYLYGPYAEGKLPAVLDEQEVNKLTKQVDAAMDFAFSEHKIQDNARGIADGRTIIARRVIRQYVEAILAYDARSTPFEMLALEAGHKEGYVLDLPIEVDGKSAKVAMKGIIDRIDRKEEVVRILDYKSGRDDRKFPSLESLFDRKHNQRNKAAMQVLYYCLLYRSRHPEYDGVLLPGLYNSRDLFASDFDVKLKMGRSPLHNFAEVEEQYTELLTEFVAEIFDPEIPFDQTDDQKKCGYCPYAGMCMRG